MLAMSAPSILDSYDTQMLDYSGDLDVQMHNASSSSDIWFHGETKMDDDANHLHSHTTPFSEHEGVEVDMEAYDVGNTEYEMADEEPYVEIVDVEVYDASTAHTPVTVPAAQPVASDPLDDGHIAFPETVLIPMSSIDFAEEEPPAVDTHADDHIPATDDDALIVPTPSFPSKSPPDHNGLSLSVQSVRATIFENDVVNPVERRSNSPRIQDHTWSDDQQQETSVSRDGSADPAEGNPGVENYTETTSSLAYPLEREGSVENSENPIRAHVEEHFTGFSDHPEKHQHDSSPADPHEISEGVYIDPPPAVLVSFPPSGPSQICLFNQPRSNSPSPSGSTTNPPEYELLLHRRPTLYYEPLSNVFEALRKEEYIRSMPDFAEGELVLDAYDLRLPMSEDNIYAREVTLHDLNVIHDGSDFSGPLRIRLSFVSPRFATRYHALRDQVGRLNIAEVERFVDDDEHNEVEENRDSKEQQHDDSEESTALAGETHSVAQEEHEVALEETTGDQSKLTAEESLEYYSVHNQNITTVEDENSISEIAAPSFDDRQLENPSAGALLEVTKEDTVNPIPEERAEYEEFIESEGDSLYKEALLGDLADPADTQQTFVDDIGEPTVVATNLQELHDSDKLETLQTAASYSSEDLSPPAEDKLNGDDVLDQRNHIESASSHEMPSLLGHADVTEGEVVADESSSHVAFAEDGVDRADHVVDSSSSARQDQFENLIDDPEEEEWDDSLDGEGDPDPTWAGEPDAASIESSTTLSITSKTHKRSFDEIEDENGDEDRGVSPDTPESKRLRVC